MSYGIPLKAVMYFFSNILFFEPLCNMSVFLSVLYSSTTLPPPSLARYNLQNIVGFVFFFPFGSLCIYHSETKLYDALEMFQNYP